MSFAQLLLGIAVVLFLLSSAIVADVLGNGNATVLALLGAASFAGSFLASNRKYGR